MNTDSKKSSNTAQPKKKRTTPAKNPANAPDVSAVTGKLPGDKESELFWESRVATWLGIDRRRLVELRRRGLREGADWEVRNQEIVYTERGVERMREFVQASEPVAPTSAKTAQASKPKTTAPAGPPRRCAATVAKVLPNPRLLMAKLDPEKGADPVLVKVRENTNFMAGMALEIVHDERDHCWQFQGRLPRRKGRW